MRESPSDSSPALEPRDEMEVRPVPESIQRRSEFSQRSSRDLGMRLTWDWPRIVQQLLNQAEYGFVHLAQQLVAATELPPRKVIAFVSSGQGDGCTSVMLTIARILAREKGRRTLILEANAGHPSHLELLKLEGQAVRELKGSDRRLAIPPDPWTLVAETLSIMPLSIREEILPSDTDRVDWEDAISREMTRWKSEYDLILMDCGPVPQLRDVRQLWWSGFIDRVVTIASSGRLAENPRGFVDDLAWEQAGIEALGVIETFA